MSIQMKSAVLGHTTTKLHILWAVHTKPPGTSQEFWINTNALNIVVFYVTFATVFFYCISLIEISQLEKLYSPVIMSVGKNMFTNGKLDNSFLSFVCAKLKFQNWVWMLCLRWWNCPVVSHGFYIITQIILAFWLVLTHDQLADRCTIDILMNFFPLCFKMAGSFGNLGNILWLGER